MLRKLYGSETNAVSVKLKILLNSWSRVLLENLTVSQLVKKFPPFMEPEVSLPYLQVSATCPFHEPDHSNPCPHPTS